MNTSSVEPSYTLSTFPVPDGLSNPMNDNDLRLIRKDRPDLDDRICFSQDDGETS